MMAVAVVHDASLAAGLLGALTQASFRVHVAADAAGAVLLARSLHPDLIVLEAALPGGAAELCRRLRHEPGTADIPAVIAGPRLSESDQLAFFAAGAADCLDWEDGSRLAAARLRAAARRCRAAPARPALADGLELDATSREARVDGRPVRLTSKEFDLLAALLEAQGRVLSARSLLRTVWGHDTSRDGDPHTVAVHVSRLRAKLGRRQGARIVSVVGHGYKLKKIG